jgi:hypothetical protein
MWADQELVQSFIRSTVTFVEMAETFATIALQSDDREKAARNKQNARKAYDIALHFPAPATLTEDQEKEIPEKLASLRSHLRELGG